MRFIISNRLQLPVVSVFL